VAETEWLIETEWETERERRILRRLTAMDHRKDHRTLSHVPLADSFLRFIRPHRVASYSRPARTRSSSAVSSSRNSTLSLTEMR